LLRKQGNTRVFHDFNCPINILPSVNETIWFYGTKLIRDLDFDPKYCPTKKAMNIESN